MALVAGGLGAAVLAAGLFVHRNQRLRTTARASGVQVAPEDKIEELAETADDATVPKAEGRLRSTLRELGVEEAELRQALAERETLGAQLEQLRKAHFLLQHRLMNETRLREELQRTRVKQNGRGAG